MGLILINMFKQPSCVVEVPDGCEDMLVEQIPCVYVIRPYHVYTTQPYGLGIYNPVRGWYIYKGIEIWLEPDQHGWWLLFKDISDRKRISLLNY